MTSIHKFKMLLLVCTLILSTQVSCTKKSGLQFNQDLSSQNGETGGGGDSISTSDLCAGVAEGASPGKAAFSATLYNLGSNSCVTCHASRQSPTWMQPNLDSAYFLAKSYLN